MENDGLKSVHAIVDDMLEDGMKVLAVAYKTVDKDEIELSDENGLTLLGYLAFFDAPKKTAAEAVKKLKALNVGIRVLTGDQKNTAVSICSRLGIDVGQVLTGRELDALAEKYSFSEWGRADEGHRIVRFCTSWATKESDVDDLIADLSTLRVEA